MRGGGGAGGRRRRRRRTRIRLPAGVLMVCALVAGAQTTWGLVIPVLPVYGDRMGADPAALGIVVAAFGLGRLLVGIPAGALAQRVNQRRLLLLAAAALAVVTLATAAVTTVEQLVVLRALTGLAGGTIMTAGQAILTNSEPDRLGRTMAALQSFHIVGGALGPALGGVVVGIDDRLPFVIGGVGLGGLALLGVVRIPGPAPSRREQQSDGATPLPPVRLWSRALVGMCVISFIIFFFRFGGQQFLVPVLAYTRTGLSPAEFGLALAAVTVGGLLLVGLAGLATDRWGRRPMVAITTVLLGLASLGFLGATYPVLFLATLVLTGVLITAGGPATGAYLADCAPPQRRGLAVGITRTCGDAATLLGPPALGALVATGNATAAVVVLGCSTTVAGVAFAWLSRGNRRDPQPQHSGGNHAGNHVPVARNHDRRHPRRIPVWSAHLPGAHRVVPGPDRGVRPGRTWDQFGDYR